MMNNNIDKLNKLSISPKSDWTTDAKFVHDNMSWLPKMGKLVIEIRSRMKDMGMIQVQLADQLGVSSQRISLILKGRENLSFDRLCVLDEIFSLHLFDRFSEDDIKFSDADTHSYFASNSYDYNIRDSSMVAINMSQSIPAS